MDSNNVIQHRMFVDDVTSEASRDCDTFLVRIENLQDADAMWSQPQRLLTGAIGICSEGGELLDLVKKLIFQGKEPTD